MGLSATGTDGSLTDALSDSGRASEADITSLQTAEFDRLIRNADRAAGFLKAISHESRLLILCFLASGEKSVSELERLLSSRQAAVSQQLARLRVEGLVVPRRDGKAIYYSLADDRARHIIDLVHDLFCGDDADG